MGSSTQHKRDQQLLCCWSSPRKECHNSNNPAAAFSVLLSTVMTHGFSRHPFLGGDSLPFILSFLELCINSTPSWTLLLMSSFPELTASYPTVQISLIPVLEGPFVGSPLPCVLHQLAMTLPHGLAYILSYNQLLEDESAISLGEFYFFILF